MTCCAPDAPLKSEIICGHSFHRRLARKTLWRVLAHRLRQNLLHHVSGHVRQAVIAPSMTECQLRVIEAKAVQNSGVEIVDVASVLDDARAQVVRLAVNHSALDAAARQPR